MQSVLMISALYVKCPYHYILVLYMQRRESRQLRRPVGQNEDMYLHTTP